MLYSRKISIERRDLTSFCYSYPFSVNLFLYIYIYISIYFYILICILIYILIYISIYVYFWLLDRLMLKYHFRCRHCRTCCDINHGRMQLADVEYKVLDFIRCMYLSKEYIAFHSQLYFGIPKVICDSHSVEKSLRYSSLFVIDITRLEFPKIQP